MDELYLAAGRELGLAPGVSVLPILYAVFGRDGERGLT
jgi:hypothetical protein